jgi:hypothetical protein
VGLETAVVISDLVETWPLQSDKIRQGAAHLRTLKSAIKNTFPNVTGAVTVTQGALNSLPADFMALLTELLKHVEHKGSVKIHDLVNAPIPSGWVVCDGHTEVGYGVVPDYRDRFVVGAGNGYVERQIGGSVSKNTATDGTHAHGGVTGGHALTIAEGPAHHHQVYGHLSGVPSGTNDALSIGAITGEVDGARGYTDTAGGIQAISTSGSGEAHDHTIGTVGSEHAHTIPDILPPYYAVVWIVKTTDFVMP